MSKKRSRVAFVGAAMAALAVMAITASSAFAAHSGIQWNVSGAGLANGESKTVTCSAAETFEFVSEVGTSPLKLTATGVECKEAKITQSIVGEAATAQDSGKLVFTGVSVVEPVGCSSGNIETVALNSELVQVPGLTSGLSDVFKPASGEIFAKITLTGCAAAETYNVKGSVCAETNALSTFAATQPLTFTPAINTTCGKELKLGTKKATLKGKGSNSISGVTSWGATAY